MLPPHLGHTTGLSTGEKEQAKYKSQACRCRMGRDKEQMSHREMGCQALRQSPLAPAPWLNLKAKFDCWHLLPWKPRLGWVLASDDSRPFPTDRSQALRLRGLSPRWDAHTCLSFWPSAPPPRPLQGSPNLSYLLHVSLLLPVTPGWRLGGGSL